MEVYVIRDSLDRNYGYTFDRAKAVEQAEVIRSEIGLPVDVEEVIEMEEA